MDLNSLWFLLLGILLTGYAVLDGFDLGVGIVHLAAKGDHDRRVILNSIGPIWDGNEVWLVTFGGALFAAFPVVYAAAFSGFYAAFMLLLFALIMRAVSIEFRSKQLWPWWRTTWDVSFSVASALAALIFGVAVGNAIQGVPLGPNHEFSASFFSLLKPYPLLVGLFTVSICSLHGTLYLAFKTQNHLQVRVTRWIWRSFGIFLALYMLTTIYTLVTIPSAVHNFKAYPAAWIVVVLNVLAIANIPRAVFLGKPALAFFSSICTIAAFNFLFGIALFPNLLVSSLNPEWNLTIYNAASSQKTLAIMRNIAFIGMPFVVTYTATIYWVFRGKVEIGKLSY